MALEIKSAPVLEGQAAREFYERWANAKEGKSAKEVQESMRTTREFLAKYYNPYKDYDVDVQEDEIIYHEPDDDLRRSITMDEFRNRALAMIERVDKMYAKK